MDHNHQLVEQSNALAPYQPQTREMSSLHSRLQEGWAAQERKLQTAQSQVAASEEQIMRLQADVRHLDAEVQRKQAQVETDASALTALKAQRDEVTSKNNAITESETNQASQRESTREEYILHLRESAHGLHQAWAVLAGGGTLSPDTVFDDYEQSIREMEASVDALASQPDAASMTAVGVEQQVFACFTRVGGALIARLRGKEVAVLSSTPTDDIIL